MAQVLSPGALPPEPTPINATAAEWKENLNVHMRCRDCREDPPNLSEDHASGDLICDTCGLVLSERTIDMSSEWRTFSNDDQGTDDPSRVGDGPNSLLRGDQLDTQIKFEGGMRNKDLARAQKNSTTDKANKTLMQAYKEIGALADAWQLPMSVTDTAKHLFKDADESKAFKGKPLDVMIAGCVFLACRNHKVPRSFREVMDLTKVTKKEIGRIFKQLEKILIEKYGAADSTTKVAGGAVAQTDQYTGSTTSDPADLCNRFCSMLNLNQRTANVAIAIAATVTKKGELAGRSPLSAAAACIFMACQLMGSPKSAKEIGDVARVSDSTIRHSYRLLYQDKDTLVTEELLGRGADPEKLSKPA